MKTISVLSEAGVTFKLLNFKMKLVKRQAVKLKLKLLNEIGANKRIINNKQASGFAKGNRILFIKEFFSSIDQIR